MALETLKIEKLETLKDLANNKEPVMEKKLEEMSNKELKRICKDKGIPTAKLTNKEKLLEALAEKGLTAVECEESPLNEGIEKERHYLGKCTKTGEKLYKVLD